MGVLYGQVTCRKMSNVYLTLVSDVTKNYKSNVANQFKVKPQLRLHGEGWKVSVAGAILPPMSLFKDLQSETDNLMQIWFDVDGVSPNLHRNRKKGYAHGNDLKAMEKENKCRTEIEFMNEVKCLLDERRQTQIPSGKKILDSQWVNLDWKREAGEPELMIHHSDRGTSIMILKKFAEKMKWLNKNTPHYDYHAGSNLVITYPSHVRELSDLSIDEPTRKDSTWLYLSSKADFRLTNLNTAFADALNLHPRPLTMTANVTANKETVTQSLGQVYYAPEGRQCYVFTPPVEEFYEVQTNHWDEVEITLKELDDQKVNFYDQSQCVIRLHFKKD